MMQMLEDGSLDVWCVIFFLAVFFIVTGVNLAKKLSGRKDQQAEEAREPQQPKQARPAKPARGRGR
ncbi:MAG: hypothetical protein HUK26_04800 [Duodenibacillus sp.]|nr:hypothetical protein [Duodenibacillus sp.]